MATVLDLFQSQNLTSSIKDFEDVPSLVVTSKRSVTGCNISCNMSRNVDVNVAWHAVEAMSHAADCLPTSQKVPEASTFLAIFSVQIVS